jgi:hypothetical protein
MMFGSLAGVIVLAVTGAASLAPAPSLLRINNDKTAPPASASKKAEPAPASDEMRTPLPKADPERNSKHGIRDPRPEPVEQMSRPDREDPAPVQTDSGTGEP